MHDSHQSREVGYCFLEKRILSANSYAEFTEEVKLSDGKSTHYALGVPSKNTGVIVLSNEDGVNMEPTIMREVVAAGNAHTVERILQLRRSGEYSRLPRTARQIEASQSHQRATARRHDASLV